MPRQPEGKLVQRMKELIIERGGRPFKIHGNDEGFQEIGIPDFLICYCGQFVGIEVKQPGGKLRPTQRVVLREIFDTGGVAAVCETVGQLAVLLSVLKKRRLDDPPKGLCFDRGALGHHFSLKC